jgi:hypothetical protein
VRFWLTAVAVAVVSTWIGVECVTHPINGWALGLSHKSDAAPVLGAGFLVVPLVIAGLALRKGWEALTMSPLARRLARQRRSR